MPCVYWDDVEERLNKLARESSKAAVAFDRLTHETKTSKLAIEGFSATIERWPYDRVKCSHCGQYGERLHECEECGAAID